MIVRFSMRAARVHAGLSIEEAAELLGLEVEILRKYEKCIEFPTIDEALLMVKVYKLETIDDMVFINKPIRFKWIQKQLKEEKKDSNVIAKPIKSLTNFNN